MSKQKRKIPPSRQRYERNNPTVSARIPVEVRDKLIAHLKTSDMSLADALKVLAGNLEIKTKPAEEIKKASFSVGFGTAKTRYGVYYKCAKCGQPILIDSAEEKEDASKFLTEEGWGHHECPVLNVPKIVKKD
jgi:hypothetical protein